MWEQFLDIFRWLHCSECTPCLLTITLLCVLWMQSIFRKRSIFVPVCLSTSHLFLLSLCSKRRTFLDRFYLNLDAFIRSLVSLNLWCRVFSLVFLCAWSAHIFTWDFVISWAVDMSTPIEVLRMCWHIYHERRRIIHDLTSIRLYVVDPYLFSFVIQQPEFSFILSRACFV